MNEIERIFGAMDKLNDAQLWSMAVSIVAFAGKRAERRQNKNVEDACLYFVNAMHKYVGTPPLVFDETPKE
jgi:hypothetical protein